MGSGSTREGSYLLKCPSEILSYVLDSCSPADHLRVSRVNKRLNGVANRFLYSTVQFRWTTPGKTDKGTPPVTIFLRSILGNPQLAALVQSLRLVGDSSFCYSFRFDMNLPTISWAGTGSTLDRAVGLVTELPVPYAQEWVRGLKIGTMDSIIAFLLTRLVNLRSFVTTANFTKEMTLQGAMFRSALCGQNRTGHQQNQVGWLPRFDQIQEVSADFYRLSYIWCDPNTDTLLPFFYLPAIQTLDLCLDSPPIFSWPATTAPDATTLTSLTLRHVRESALKGILSSTKQLIKLDWEFLYSESNMSTQQIRGSLQGLVEFPKVERFEVPLPFLAGRLIPNNRYRVSKRIPQNLRTLVLNEDLKDFADEKLGLNDWDYDEIALNLGDWLLFEEFESDTPFLKRLNLRLPLDGREGGLYCKLKRLLGKERVPVKVTLLGEEPEPEPETDSD
ncbi:hypothetical protein PG984_002438 [Apiospora sp. TS-2023a]